LAVAFPIADEPKALESFHLRTGSLHELGGDNKPACRQQGQSLGGSGAARARCGWIDVAHAL